MTTIEFLSVAERELTEAMAWYAVRSNGTARRFLIRVEMVIRLIAEAPARYPRVGRLLRRARLGGFPFAVYYRVTAESIVVVGLIHARRDPAVWQDRDA